MVNENEKCIGASMLNSKQKKVRRGKVIHHFLVEVVDSESDPALKPNASNPYAQLTEEERMRDLAEMFGILWGETCREAGKNPSEIKK